MNIEIHSTRREMGRASAAMGAEAILDAIRRDGEAKVVFASAVSQNEFLDALALDTRIDWPRVTAFHLDEYTGISADHPASFRRFLKDRLFSRVRPAAFHELLGDSPDLEAEVRRYSQLLEKAKPTIGFLGIGENGHLAFNDPPVDFDDPQAVKIVQLDRICRMQQVHDGAFAALEDVPAQALTLTVPSILRLRKLVLNVPGRAKAEAVRAAVEGPVTEMCPASILQRHTDAHLFLDSESASLLRSGRRDL